MKILFLTFFFLNLFNFYPLNDFYPKSEPFIFKDQVFKKGIETVLIYKKGWELSFPVIELGKDEQIVLMFDEIGNNVNDYSWTIIHCNANWEQSDLNPIEYIDGFNETDIDNYALSQNTMVNYVNYSLEFPNDDSKPLISGNYVVKVFERYNPDNVILTKRFCIFESLAGISANVEQLSIKAKDGLNQRVNLEIRCNKEIENPAGTIYFKAGKNPLLATNFLNLKPSFVNGNLIKYTTIDDFAFPGGNEFRHIDLKNFKFLSDRIKNIAKGEEYYQVYLRIDENRAKKEYRFEHDLNGRKLIKLEKNDLSNIMADYCYVYFYLDAEIPLDNGDYYVFGALTDWDYKESAKMTYNFDEKKFTAKLFLKQGYYNYLYLYKTDDKLFSSEADSYYSEGNFYLTENEYYILIYYKDYKVNYERLAGYAVINSIKNNNY